ncbi:unnamed protein product [Clavelina lepadiformis]|uniref:Uncharacterized protein n=1 Tax=Clavelina lepadiformis TaxID=159417 RepID=A0ABP0GPW6_CLALP
MDNMSDCTQKEIPVEESKEESNTVVAATLEKKCTAEQYDNAPAEVVADKETCLLRSRTQKVMPVKGCNECDNARAEVMADEGTDVRGTQKQKK